MRENNDLILSNNYHTPSLYPNQNQHFNIPPWDPVEVDPDSCYLGIKYNSGYEWFRDSGYQFHKVSRFISDQFERFGVPLPDHDGLWFIWETALMLVNHDENYLIHFGLSDVEQRGEPQYYQFALYNKDDGSIKEIDMDNAELFRYFRQDRKQWEFLYKNPGLKNIGDFYEDFLQEIFSDYYHNDTDEQSQFIAYYEDRKTSAYDALHMGVWAALLWTLSEEAEHWRRQHDIIHYCYNYGECLIVSSTIYHPSMYRIINRPANSCAFCFKRIPCLFSACINLPRGHELYRSLSSFRGESEYRSVFAHDITPGKYKVCNHCLSNLAYPVPHCLYTGCSETFCPHHAAQANKSSKLLV